MELFLNKFPCSSTGRTAEFFSEIKNPDYFIVD